MNRLERMRESAAFNAKRFDFALSVSSRVARSLGRPPPRVSVACIRALGAATPSEFRISPVALGGNRWDLAVTVGHETAHAVRRVQRAYFVLRILFVPAAFILIPVVGWRATVLLAIAFAVRSAATRFAELDAWVSAAKCGLRVGVVRALHRRMTISTFRRIDGYPSPKSCLRHVLRAERET